MPKRKHPSSKTTPIRHAVSRTWQWEELTEPDLRRAIKGTKGVCIIPVGILERHSDHLPVGTDMLLGHDLAVQAASSEPAVVFPPYFLGQIHENKHHVGAIALRIDLIMSLLENLCDEIARNGFRKIVLLNAHGGNESFLSLFNWKKLEKPRPYSLYTIRLIDYYQPPRDDPWWKTIKNPDGGHADEVETSLALALRPGLVKMKAVPKDPAAGKPLGRLRHLPLGTPLWWYADYPGIYAGDARHATAEKGRYLAAHAVKRIATALRAIKCDNIAPQLEAEFFSKIQH